VRALFLRHSNMVTSAKRQDVDGQKAGITASKQQSTYQWLSNHLIYTVSGSMELEGV